FAPLTAADEGLTTSVTTSTTRGHHASPRVKSDRHKHSFAIGSLRANGNKGHLHNSGSEVGKDVDLKDPLFFRDAELKDSVVCLTHEKLQRILNTVQNFSNDLRQSEDQRTQENQTDSQSGSSTTEGGEEMKEEDRGGGGGTDTPGVLQDKDKRASGCLFSWLGERESDSRAAMETKKAQWRRELIEQMALKQQRSASGRLQAKEDTESVLSVQSSISHREQPAAIRSSLRLGVITPMEEVVNVERKEEEKRRWLQELDRQREEMMERKKREKLLQRQAEDHDLWASHFDSLQQRPLFPTGVPPAPPPAPHAGSERGDWEPSSSLSLVWDATSSCGAESVGGASVELTSRYPTRTNYLRTMTALLDPVQIEERERKRLKQLEQQRAIEAQMEERRQQREREEERRRVEEVEEERRVALERERLQRQYELDTQRERPKEQPKEDFGGRDVQETPEPSASSPAQCLKKMSSHKDIAVQTEAVPLLPLRPDRVQTPEVPAQYRPPPSLSAAPPNGGNSSGRNRAVRTGKENICVSEAGGEDLYEAFARTERNRKDKRRPEWNTQRPSHRFVPASQRYPAALQKNRQESRLKRQAELLALQERTCVSRTEPHLCSNGSQTRTSSKKVEVVSRGQGSSAAASAGSVRSQQVSSSPPHPPVLEFIPYVRTDEVLNLGPLEPADTPPPLTHAAALPPSSVSPPAPSHREHLVHPELLHNTRTPRQLEILRGLAQLRQGLLQKQRELETDQNPLIKRHDNQLRSPSTTLHM
ncbi:coiled-coil domain-containing protein 66, partial [Aulostomus maculatus]